MLSKKLWPKLKTSASISVLSEFSDYNPWQITSNLSFTYSRNFKFLKQNFKVHKYCCSINKKNVNKNSNKDLNHVAWSNLSVQIFLNCKKISKLHQNNRCKSSISSAWRVNILFKSKNYFRITQTIHSYLLILSCDSISILAVTYHWKPYFQYLHHFTDSIDYTEYINMIVNDKHKWKLNKNNKGHDKVIFWFSSSSIFLSLG